MTEQLEYNYPAKCYLAWNTDASERRICASGGIATALGRYVINKLGGVVFGARYGDDFVPVISPAENVEELEAFKGSKYVQSIAGVQTYKAVESFLDAGRTVLYIALPCQIAGLISYLHGRRENLYTVDLMCHGTAPASYLTQELEYLKKRHKISHISDVRFRGNDGNNFKLTLWDGDECLYCGAGETQPYLRAFLKGLSLKEACYSCQFSRPERVADLTIGDFIGIPGNNSCILADTSKGAQLLSAMLEYDKSISCEERPYSTRLQYKPSLLMPYPRHPKRSRFLALNEKYGFAKAARKAMVCELFFARVNWSFVRFKRALGIKGRITKKRKSEI